MTVCSKSVFRESGWELITDKQPESKPQDLDNDSRADSVRRAKQKVFELAMLNQFTHFITWTLDKQEIDRYDAKEVSKKLKQYLGNQTRRRDLTYIIIPEHHQDGAIHMHGLIRGNFDMEDSHRLTKHGQVIYNMPQWKYGWSTAIELDTNVLAIARYITKYITKDMQKIFGNFYYAGGSLIREPDVQLTDTECFDSINAKAYYVDAIRASFKYIDVDISTEVAEYPQDYFDVA